MAGAGRLSAIALSLLVGLGLGGDAVRLGGPPPVRAMPAGAATIAATLGVAPVTDTARAAAVAALATRCVQAVEGDADAVVPPLPAIQGPDSDRSPLDWAARWGFGITTAPPVAGVVPPAVERWLDHPCHRLATRTVHGLRDRVLAPLHDELGRLADGIAVDPGRRAAERDWRRCVRPVEPAATRATLPGVLQARFRAALAHVVTGDDRAVLQSTERAVAVVVARCEVVYQVAVQRVRAAYERRFVRRHAALLATLGASIRRIEATYPSGP